MPHRTAHAAVSDAARLQAIHRLGLIDAPPHLAFDRLTRLVRQLLDVPIALATLVDEDRQFFLSASGMAEPLATKRETPRSHSFCQYVVGTGRIFRVEDARTDVRLRDSPAIAELGARAYLGVPLVTADGLVLGALCALDTQPRAWTEAQEATLADLAAMAATELALRALTQDQAGRLEAEAAARSAAEEALGFKRRLDALGQIAGGVVHDFANVLQAVQAGVRLAENHLERDPAKARRMLESVAEAARRGTSITRRLLDFARRDPAPAEPVQLGAVIADLHDMLVRTLNAPGLEIRVDTAADLPPVAVDRGELETVIVNLATNARDAMPQGGRLLLGAALDATPAGGSLPPGRYVRLVAADTGTGMSATTASRAAEPFFTTKPDGKGSGLGLSLARDFAQQAGGGFALETEPGRGTRVTLWLPVAEPMGSAQ